MPHVWYAHKAFWILSVVMNCLAFAALFVYTDIADFQTNLIMKLKYIIMQSVFIVISLLLSTMVIKYPREHPQYLRNYLAVTAMALKKGQNDLLL